MGVFVHMVLTRVQGALQSHIKVDSVSGWYMSDGGEEAVDEDEGVYTGSSGLWRDPVYSKGSPSNILLLKLAYLDCGGRYNIRATGSCSGVLCQKTFCKTTLFRFVSKYKRQIDSFKRKENRQKFLLIRDVILMSTL